MMGGDVIRSGVIRPLVQSSPLSPPSGYAAAAAAAAAAAIVPLVAAAKDKPPKGRATASDREEQRLARSRATGELVAVLSPHEAD